MQSMGHVFTHMVHAVHVLMSLWRNPRYPWGVSHRSSGYCSVTSSLGSTPYRAVIRIPFAVVTTASTMSFRYAFRPMVSSEQRGDHPGDPLALEDQEPEGDAEEVDERQRNQVFPRHPHQLVHAQAGQGPADPHHDQHHRERHREDHAEGEHVPPDSRKRADVEDR